MHDELHVGNNILRHIHNSDIHLIYMFAMLNMILNKYFESTKAKKIKSTYAYIKVALITFPQPVHDQLL